MFLTLPTIVKNPPDHTEKRKFIFLKVLSSKQLLTLKKISAGARGILEISEQKSLRGLVWLRAKTSAGSQENRENVATHEPLNEMEVKISKASGSWWTFSRLLTPNQLFIPMLVTWLCFKEQRTPSFGFFRSSEIRLQPWIQTRNGAGKSLRALVNLDTREDPQKSADQAELKHNQSAEETGSRVKREVRERKARQRHK